MWPLPMADGTPLPRSLLGVPSPFDEIAETFTQLDAWAGRVRQPFQPDPGTPLHLDEEPFPWLTAADLAWQALAGAQDHLKGFRAWFLARDLYPIATFSLLRGAMVGGALASWLLLPDDAEVRIGRALAVADEWYRNHLLWADEMSALAVYPTRYAELTEHVRNRRRQAAERRGDYPRADFKMTDIIREVTEQVWAGDDARLQQTMGLWRAGSGDAHALGWPVLTRVHEMTPIDGGQMGQYVGLPSEMDTANASLCAYDFVAFGFHRLDALGVAPPT